VSFMFARLKNWLGYENFNNTDLNAELNNILQKAGSDTLSSANSTNGSAPTVAAMQAQLSPGGLGTEVLALTNQQDIQQLRFVLASITGNSFWYQAPAQSIAAITSQLQSLFTVPTTRIISGRVDANGQPMFLVASGVADSVTLKATVTNFIAFINGTQRNYVADITLSGLTVAPGAGNTAIVNDASLTGQQSSQTQGEFGTFLNINTIGANITARNGTYAAFKHGSEYFVAEVDTTNNRLKNAIRGAGFDQSDNWIARSTVSNGDTVTLMNLAWIFATFNSNTPGLDVTYNKPTVSVVQPSTPSVGDYWYDVVNTTWKKYNGVSFAATNAVPLGFCIIDTSNVVAARSFDFFKPFNLLNTIEIEFLSTTQVRQTRVNQQVSVYGVTFPFQLTQAIWNVSTTLDTGTSLLASTQYYTYVTNTGDIKTSFIAPYERKYDLLGQYHPAKPWRCVGSFSTDGGSLITSSSVSIVDYHQLTLPGRGSTIIGQLIDLIVNSLTVGGGSGGTKLTNAGGSGLASSGGANGLFYPNTLAAAALTGSLGPKTLGVYDVGGVNSVYPAVISASTGGSGLKIIRATFHYNGASMVLTAGEGATATRASAGSYTVNFTVAFADVPIVIPGIAQNSQAIAGSFSAAVGSVNIFTNNIGVGADFDFSIIAIGQRGN